MLSYRVVALGCVLALLVMYGERAVDYLFSAVAVAVICLNGVFS